MHHARTALLPGVLVGAAFVSGSAQAQGMAAPLDTEIAVYARSKGKGVPERAREALSYARGLMIQWRAEGRVLDILDVRIGFEGARRLCARFATGADAADAMKELAALGKGVDLFNVKVEPSELRHLPVGRA